MAGKVRDFRNFLYIVWKHLNLPEPTPIQYDIAEFLQDMSNHNRMVQGYRGVGKSWISSAYVMWRLHLNPELKFLVVSASSNRAKDFTRFCKRLIAEIPILNGLQPSSEQRNSVDSFDVYGISPAHAPYVKAVGVAGQLTGSRADEIISDDIEILQNSITAAMREKLSNVIGEFTSILKPNGYITFLGTPQSVDSVYNGLSNTVFRIYPARYPALEDLDAYKGNLAPRLFEELNKDPLLVGQPTDPLRFDEDELLRRELEQGRSTFQLQYMLNTSLTDADRYPLKLNDLIVTELSDTKAPEFVVHSTAAKDMIKDIPLIGMHKDSLHRPSKVSEKWLPYQSIVMSIDPSGLGKDETAYSVVGYTDCVLYLLDNGGFKGGGYDDSVLLALAKIAKRFKVNDVIIENNFGGGMFTKLFRPILLKFHRCGINEVKSTTNKELRIIDTLEPLFNQHKLVVNYSVVDKDLKEIENNPRTIDYSLFYQLTRFTREKGSVKHDDRLDSLAMAVEYWIEFMDVDAETLAKMRAEEELDKLIQEWGFTDDPVDTQPNFTEEV
jgi:hypothetical protein